MPTKPKTHKVRHGTPRHEPIAPSYGQGRGGRPWRRLRLMILNRDGWLCQCDECKRLGRVLVAHEVDHHIPLSRGGTDDPSNLRAINRDCHKAKTQREGGRRYPKRSRNAVGT
ncbi:hypothetical protein CAL20_02850 [Bordetella genomosp. 4]|uniref:HNH nuclease domain-containing protein n=2 Tax=Bordetella genomosp. 4 TaxID=463044 RepID=A0A261UST4_9BORD|nr:hypothetical protein CAL20_02850 [Bordetella genomosp. 4]